MSLIKLFLDRVEAKKKVLVAEERKARQSHQTQETEKEEDKSMFGFLFSLNIEHWLLLHLSKFTFAAFRPLTFEYWGSVTSQLTWPSSVYHWAQKFLSQCVLVLHKHLIGGNT